jgi:hypothetical protein
MEDCSGEVFAIARDEDSDPSLCPKMLKVGVENAPELRIIIQSPETGVETEVDFDGGWFNIGRESVGELSDDCKIIGGAGPSRGKYVVG